MSHGRPKEAAVTAFSSAVEGLVFGRIPKRPACALPGSDPCAILAIDSQNI
jgi:hypothetical protein